jgi:hypothetical protein
MTDQSRSTLALIKDRLRGFPNIRKAQNITETERDTCERYGEHVIGTMLASGLNPPSKDLVALNQTEETRQHARDWLTERADYRDTLERWKSFRDLVLEIAVIVLIGLEIWLSVKGLREGREQAKVIEHMDHSTADTADAMKAARDSLRTLNDAQTISLDRLNDMDANLQASLARTSTMVSTTRNQLEILKKEQSDRLAQEAKKPKPALFVGPLPLINPPLNSTITAREETDTSMAFDFTLANLGDAPANKIELRAMVPQRDVSITASVSYQQIPQLAGSPFNIIIFPLDHLRPGQQLQVEITFNYPKGHLPFEVMFSIDANEIQAGTPLGRFMVTPRKPTK